MIVAGHKQMWWIEDAHPMLIVNSTTATNFSFTHSVSQLDYLVNHQAQKTKKELGKGTNQVSGTDDTATQCY